VMRRKSVTVHILTASTARHGMLCTCPSLTHLSGTAVTDKHELEGGDLLALSHPDVVYACF